jgi:hypothetical protein
MSTKAKRVEAAAAERRKGTERSSFLALRKLAAIAAGIEEKGRKTVRFGNECLMCNGFSGGNRK